MKRQIIGLVAVLGLFGLACGLLDDDATTVTYYESIPVQFDLDANQFCDAGADFDCEDDQREADAEIELGHIQEGDDIDIVERTGNEELRDIGQRLRTLEITSIGYQVSDNDLTFDLPEIDLFIGPIGTDDVEDDDVVYLTSVPQTDAGTDAEGDAPVDEENREASSEYFRQMEFAGLTALEPKIREGQLVPPSGDAQVEVTINIKIQANPRDEF